MARFGGVKDSPSNKLYSSIVNSYYRTLQPDGSTHGTINASIPAGNDFSYAEVYFTFNAEAAVRVEGSSVFPYSPFFYIQETAGGQVVQRVCQASPLTLQTSGGGSGTSTIANTENIYAPYQGVIVINPNSTIVVYAESVSQTGGAAVRGPASFSVSIRKIK